MIAAGQADVAPVYFHFGRYLTAVFPALFDFVMLPEARNHMDTLAMTLLNGARNLKGARAWLDFMRAETARRAYEEHTFIYATTDELVTLVVPQ